MQPEDLADLPDLAAVGALQDAWAEVSRGHARYLEALLEVANRAPTRWQVPEVAAALTFTNRRAEKDLTLADTLVNHVPLVFTALATGSIDHHKAAVFADHLSLVTAEQAATIAAHLLPNAPSWTTGQLAARLLREIHAIDPAHSRRRYQQGVEDRRVYGYLAEDGTAVLAAHGLPAADAVAAAERLEKLADRLHAAGYPATLTQTRADLFLRLLDGSVTGLSGDQIVAAMLAMGPVHPDGQVAAETAEPADARPGDAGTGVEVRLSLTTLLELDDNPAEVPGWGPVPAFEARRLVTEQHGAQWRIAVTDADGYLVHGDVTRYRPDGPSADQRVGGIVEIQVPASMIDQLERLGTGHPRWARVLTDIARRWARRRDLQAAMNRHPSGRSARAALRRHVEMRDRTCTFPGCRRPARRTDLDHTDDYASGGPTADHNCGAVCPMHHEMKTRGVWRQRQPRPGHFEWTSALGCTYRTRGEPILHVPAPKAPPEPPPLRPPIDVGDPPF